MLCGMKLPSVLCVALLALSACRTAPPADWSAVQSELTERVALDQELRNQLQPGAEMDMEVVHKMEQCDQENTAWMKDLVDRHGWPTIARVGKRGAADAWLLVQHAPLEFQEQCLPLLRAAVEAKDAEPVHLAYLEDRVNMYRGRPQRYGTQFKFGANGLEVHTLEDAARVDEWRAEVGLGTLAEYEAQLRGQ